jgi:hypothetical protein
MDKSRYINISRQYKFFAWTHQRTGSTHFTNILKKLNFESAELNLETKKLSNFASIVKHNHTCLLFENHSDYKFIVSVRNPYSMVVSHTGVMSLPDFSRGKEKFRNIVENQVQNPHNPDGCCNCFHERTPDYAIRLEHLYEDWLKIPFVRSHELNTSGELEKLCNVPLNGMRKTITNSWKEYYDQTTADSVYYSQPYSFELFGYDRDSWK